jgi:hypothetical protein
MIRARRMKRIANCSEKRKYPSQKTDVMRKRSPAV